MRLLTPSCAIGPAVRKLSEQGIVHRVRGQQIEVDDSEVARATRALSTSEPFGNIEPESRPRRDDERPDDDARDPVEEQLRRTIKTLEKKVDDQAAELADLKRGKRADPAPEDAKHRERKSADALASSIRSKAVEMGISVGELASDLKLSASDIRRFGFDERELLPLPYQRALGATRKDPAISYDDDGNVAMGLMSPAEGKAIYEQSQRNLERLGR